MAAVQRSLLAVVLALVAAAVFFLTASSPPPAVVPKEVPALRAEPSVPPPAPPDAAPSPTPRAAKKVVDESFSGLVRRYRAQKDLRAFYDEMAASGDAGRLHLAQTILGRCGIVGARGMVGAEQRFNSQAWDDGKGEARAAAHREWIAPCAGFETRPVDISGEYAKLAERFRKSSGPLAVPWQDSPPAAFNAAVRNAISADDLDLVAALAPSLMYRTQTRDLQLTNEQREEWVRQQMSEMLSWTLATCEMGRDCGRGSGIWFGMCQVSGNCAEGNYRDMDAFRMVQPLKGGDMAAVVRRRDEMVAAIRARDWAALGLAP